jgi:hypothetical protein
MLIVSDRLASQTLLERTLDVANRKNWVQSLKSTEGLKRFEQKETKKTKGGFGLGFRDRIAKFPRCKLDQCE